MYYFNPEMKTILSLHLKTDSKIAFKGTSIFPLNYNFRLILHFQKSEHDLIPIRKEHKHIL